MSVWREIWADLVHEWRAAGALGRCAVLAGGALALLRALLALWPEGMRPFRDLGRDVAYAARRLTAAPLFTLFAVITLALSIGATTAVYSTVHAIAFKAPAVDQVEQVVKLYHAPGGSASVSGFSWPDFLDLKARQQSFSHLAAWSRFTSAMATPLGSRPVVGEMVDGDYFATLRATPLHGRLLQPADDDPAAPPVVVLGAEFWTSAFGSDPAVVGSTVLIGGEPFVVAGVARPDVRGVDMPTMMPAAAWIPIRQRMRVARPGYLAFDSEHDRNHRWVRVIARLRDGQALDRAGTELREIGAALDTAVPLGNRNSRAWLARPLTDVRIHESMDRVATPVITTVFTAVGLVLLVACTNLANLLLARGATRRHELSVRRALGASRARVIREQLVECALLAVAGGGAGILVARWLLIALSTDFSVGDSAIVISVRPELNAGALLVASGATALAMAVFGLVPAWHASGGDVRAALAVDGGGTIPRWRGRRLLIGAQVAVSVALLALTAVSAGNAWRLSQAATGIAFDELALVAVDPSASKASTADTLARLDRAAERARQVPGVSAVTLATALPIGTGSANLAVRPPDQPDRGTWVRAVEAGAGYLSATGWPLLHGRDITAEDRGGAAIVISARAAQRVFGATDVVGRTLTYRRQASVGEPEPIDATSTVVGVAADVSDPGRRGTDEGIAVLALGPDTPNRRLTLIARTATPDATAARLRTVVSEVDQHLALSQVATGASVLDGVTMLLRVVGGTAGVLGGFALLLALVGLYGVLSFVVARRRREIGVRMALGAERSTVRRMVLRDGLRPVAWGLVIGSLLVTPVLVSPLGQSMLRLEDGGLMWAALAPAAMLTLAILATWIPARRASAVDPTIALRDQ